MPKAHTPEHDLIKAAREMVAHARGEISLPTRKVTPPSEVDVASIRKNLGYNQRQFADHFGFALSAVKDWEQGRRTPERATRIFLAIIATNPAAIEQALTRLSD
jgi:putative transcriptional regulator